VNMLLDEHNVIVRARSSVDAPVSVCPSLVVFPRVMASLPRRLPIVRSCRGLGAAAALLVCGCGRGKGG
jgi:hypothetical protein